MRLQIPGLRAIEHNSKSQTDPRCFEWQVRVYYQDTDAVDVVYHARYLDFMERARSEWLRALGLNLSRLAAEHRRMFVASSVTIDYLKSARLDDMLTVLTTPSEIARTYLDLNQDIVCGSTLLTRGRVRIACVDTSSMRPTRLPGEIPASVHDSGPSA
jgi:acyl-CoA thioester hydrolase